MACPCFAGSLRTLVIVFFDGFDVFGIGGIYGTSGIHFVRSHFNIVFLAAARHGSDGNNRNHARKQSCTDFSFILLDSLDKRGLVFFLDILGHFQILVIRNGKCFNLCAVFIEICGRTVHFEYEGAVWTAYP